MLRGQDSPGATMPFFADNASNDSKTTVYILKEWQATAGNNSVG
jgi:hypothetical protein